MAEQNSDNTTEYFQNKLKHFGSLSVDFYENEKYNREAIIAFDHAKADLETGILAKFRALRMQELDRLVNRNCYKNKNYNFLQAQKWASYTYENDYKLGLLNNYTRDHSWKYMLDYKNCTRTDEFKSLPSLVEKDRVYQECHEKFMNQWKDRIVPELSERAKQLFESTD